MYKIFIKKVILVFSRPHRYASVAMRCGQVFFCFLVFLTIACTNQTADNYFKIININDRQLKVEIADTPAKQSQGLSNRSSLPAGHGMLFVFEDYTKPSFWMKDMQFPIDIIWIKDNTVIGIEKNIQPPENTYLNKYFPSQPINYVLEVNANWADKNSIKIGHKIKGL